MAPPPITPPNSDPGPATIRSIVLLVVQRGITIVGGVLFAAVVSRLMGPATYGRYALMTSLAYWLVMIGSLGMMNVVARYVPGLALREPVRLDAVLGNLLTLRLLTGAVAAVVYLAVMTVWLGDLELAALVVLAMSVLVQAVANFMFASFLGFKQTGRWAAADGLRRWLSLALIVPAYLLGGLTGACAALLITDVTLLALGAWWGRFWLKRVDFGLEFRAFAPYLKLGLAFYATRLLSVALSASGEPLVRTFSGDYVEVGYFALAHAMYLAAGAALAQLAQVFVPVLGEFVDQGEAAAATRWTGRLLTWLVALGVVVVIAALLLGDAFVALVLGPAYAPVAANLVPLAVALFVLTFASVLATLANVYDRPRPVVIAACLRLSVLWAVAPQLITAYGGWGCSVAMALAAAVHSVCLGWLMRDTLTGVMGAPGRAAILGALVLPLVWLRPWVGADLLLFVAITVVYGALLLGCGILKRAEFKALIDTMRIGNLNVRAGRSPATP